VKPFQISIPSKAFNLYPFGDIHWGSPNCNQNFVRQVVRTVKDDPEGKMVLMGDLTENAIIGSLGDVYKQEKGPQLQVEELVELLKPVSDKILFAITGNHEERTAKRSDIDPSQVICWGLDIPYMRYSCIARFILTGKGPKSFVCFFHHNTGGGATPGGKVNKAAKLRNIVPHADAIFSAHTHITSSIENAWYDITVGNTGAPKKIKRHGYDYVIGSALEYEDSYADAKALRPAVCSFIRVRFENNSTGQRDGRRQIYSVIQPANGGIT